VEVSLLDRDRLLITFLFSMHMCNIASQFDGFKWRQAWQRHYAALLATVEAFEIALGCPEFATPRAVAHANTFVAPIGEEHRRGHRERRALSALALRPLPSLPVARDETLASAIATRIAFQREAIHSLVALPQDRTKIVWIGERHVAAITLTQDAVGLVLTSIVPGDATALIGHHNINLGLRLCAVDVIRFARVHDRGEVGRFDISSQEKVPCAAFASNGSKL
jgi:hypothetical protein